jgi:hypothetical protein
VWLEVPPIFVWKAAGVNRSPSRKERRYARFHLVEDIVMEAGGQTIDGASSDGAYARITAAPPIQQLFEAALRGVW